MCNRVQPFGSKSNCKVIVNGSLSRLRVVIHVITESYSRTQAKDDSIEYSFQCFDEQHHSDALKPKNSSRQLCPD